MNTLGQKVMAKAKINVKVFPNILLKSSGPQKFCTVELLSFNVLKLNFEKPRPAIFKLFSTAGVIH